MYLKIMSDQDLPDEDMRKNFALIQCDRVYFNDSNDNDGKVSASYWVGDDVYDELLTGNAYVMDASGKTIARKWCEGKILEWQGDGKAKAEREAADVRLDA